MRFCVRAAGRAMPFLLAAAVSQAPCQAASEVKQQIDSGTIRARQSQITWTVVFGEIVHWIDIHLWRGSEDDDPPEFHIRTRGPQDPGCGQKDPGRGGPGSKGVPSSIIHCQPSESGTGCICSRQDGPDGTIDILFDCSERERGGYQDEHFDVSFVGLRPGSRFFMQAGPEAPPGLLRCGDRKENGDWGCEFIITKPPNCQP